MSPVASWLRPLVTAHVTTTTKPTTARLMSNVDNLGTMVANPPDAPPEPAHTKRRGWFGRWWWVIVTGVVIASAVSVLTWSLVVTVPYVIESPGDLNATGDLIHINGTQSFPTNDRIFLVTVSVDKDVSKLEQ